MGRDKTHHNNQHKKQKSTSMISSQQKKQSISQQKPYKQSFGVWLFNTILAIFISTIFLNRICQKNYDPFFIYKTATSQQIIQSFVVFICYILIIHGILSDGLDIINKINNVLYRTHKNIINNTILWSVVFWGLILYNRQKIAKTGLEIALVDLFLLSRVIFSIGYVLGSAIGHQSFRAVGFGLTFTPVVVVLAQILDCSIISYFQVNVHGRVQDQYGNIL